MMSVHLSIVTYNSPLAELEKVYDSISLSKLKWTLFIIDNSPTDRLRDFFVNKNNVRYIFNNANIGFGAGHNIAIKESIKMGIQHHFIVNPDIYFNEDVITPMVNYAEVNSQVGMLMPEVLYPDKTVQYLPKLLPSPINILWRKLKVPKKAFERFIARYELRDVPREMVYTTPILSGCFTLLNIEAIKVIGGYDDKYFMYFEDWDLSRRIAKLFKTVYYPKVSVFHGYDSGANKNLKLFKIYVKSAIYYFNKWGWFFDAERKAINVNTLRSLNIEN